MHVSDVPYKLLTMSRVHPGSLKGGQFSPCHDVKLILIQGLPNNDTEASIEVAKMDVV